MSKRILFILSSSLLIAIILCAGSCSEKYPYDYDITSTAKNRFTDGDTRMVWNHEHSCNSLEVEPVTDTETNNYADKIKICCYIHIEYESAITNERHDKYGCIEVLNPYEDYNGTIDNVKKAVEDVKTNLTKLTVQGSNDRAVSDDHLHVKIVCGANFSKISLFALLILILF